MNDGTDRGDMEAFDRESDVPFEEMGAEIRTDSDGDRRAAGEAIVKFARCLGVDMPQSRDLHSAIRLLIDLIDASISEQLRVIVHHEDFRRLEASWLGLSYVVHRSEVDPLLRIRVLNVTKGELIRDMERSLELEQSILHKKVYDEAIGAPGGEPFGVLIGDYEFTHHVQDVSLLGRISNVAAAAFSPFISAVSPRFLGFESWPELSRPLDLESFITTPEYSSWRSFRASEDASYVGLCLPHILMRPVHGREVVPDGSFQFKEMIRDNGPSGCLWGNAAYAFAACLVESFARYHWCVEFRGISGGGLVWGLPVERIETELGEPVMIGPTEVAIPESHDLTLSDLGLIPLVYCQGTDYAAFLTARSCRRAKPPAAGRADEDAQLATELSYVMAVSRIVHYLKVMVRDQAGKFMSREECESYLYNWISRYVTDDEDREDMKAKYPLRAAWVEVQDIPTKPGSFGVVVYLQPHFRLNRPVRMRVFAELTQ